ncbi:MAG: Ku protein [Euryarchaeota archaeon RBG_16_68_12]|nr:MAG: Ku protein [Euryarchaeota archaeon RBG_16_68_12]
MASARAIWSGSISFGLVNIPVKLYTATETKDISFTTLHAACKSPLKRPYMCPLDNVPVESKDMVKGYQVGKGQYILLTDDEIEGVRVESSAHINVAGFVEAQEIGPLFYESSYYLGPLETSVKPFELFRQALLRTNKVAIAQATLWRKEHLVALRPVDGGLVLTTLYYADEVKPPPEVPATKPVAITDDEMNLAVNLVTALAADFDPSRYKDRYREALLQMIEAKIGGKTIEVPAPSEAHATQDLMAALRASVAAAQK